MRATAVPAIGTPWATTATTTTQLPVAANVIAWIRYIRAGGNGRKLCHMIDSAPNGRTREALEKAGAALHGGTRNVNRAGFAGSNRRMQGGKDKKPNSGNLPADGGLLYHLRYHMLPADFRPVDAAPSNLYSAPPAPKKAECPDCGSSRINLLPIWTIKTRFVRKEI